jgi:hypothetical protein
MIVAALGTWVLWNKADLLFEMPMSLSQLSHPLLSPPGDDLGYGDDDDDNGGNGNDSASGLGSSP